MQRPSGPTIIVPHGDSYLISQVASMPVAAGTIYGALRLSQLGHEAEHYRLVARDAAQQAAREALAARRAALGIPAEFATTDRRQVGGKRPKKAAAGDPRVTRRYARQSTSARLLPGWRVASCCRTPTGAAVAVNYHPAHQSASYGGLQTCGSAWVCPVCSAKIAARRTEELKSGIAAWRARGGHLYMLTLTARHHSGQSLAELHDGVKAAYRAMHQDRRWQLAALRYGIIGYVTAFEHTHGDRGWHPHIHALLFTTDDLGPRHQGAAEWFARRWQDALAKQGLTATLAHGADLRPADDKASEYIGKLGRAWTAAAELGAGAEKKARSGNRTPAALLDLAAVGDVEAGELWQEYAAATKGDSWLRWSTHLRELCGLAEEKSDEAVAAEQTEQATNLCLLTLAQWRRLVAAEQRGPLLAEAAHGDAERLQLWLLCQGVTLQPEQIRVEFIENEKLRC